MAEGARRSRGLWAFVIGAILAGGGGAGWLWRDALPFLAPAEAAGNGEEPGVADAAPGA